STVHITTELRAPYRRAIRLSSGICAVATLEHAWAAHPERTKQVGCIRWVALLYTTQVGYAVAVGSGSSVMDAALRRHARYPPCAVRACTICRCLRPAATEDRNDAILRPGEDLYQGRGRWQRLSPLSPREICPYGWTGRRRWRTRRQHLSPS